jgi:hypothetical protein
MTSRGFSGAGMRSMITWRGGGGGAGMTFSMTVACGISGGHGGRSRITSGGGVGGAGMCCLM